MKAVDITFFVPCLNEEKNIKPTLENIFAALRPFPWQCEILAVDDGSTDKTFAILNEMSQNHPPIPIQIFRNRKPKGIGHNFFAMAHQAKGKYYMIVNGDNVEPVESIRMIISQTGKADMIIPYFGKGDRRSLSRRLLSWFFVHLVNRLSGNKIHYYNGPVLHRTENIRLENLKVNGFGYQAEFICKLVQDGKTYAKVQVNNLVRHYGTSKAFRLTNILSVTQSLLRIFWRRIQK